MHTISGQPFPNPPYKLLNLPSPTQASPSRPPPFVEPSSSTAPVVRPSPTPKRISSIHISSLISTRQPRTNLLNQALPVPAKHEHQLSFSLPPRLNPLTSLTSAPSLVSFKSCNNLICSSTISFALLSISSVSFESEGGAEEPGVRALERGRGGGRGRERA